MQKFIDPDHPFYRPLWRRLLIVGSCAAWTAIEFWNRNDTWGLIFLAVTAYTAATLIVFFKPATGSAPAPVAETPEGDLTVSRDAPEEPLPENRPAGDRTRP